MRNNFREKVSSYLELGKVKIMLPVGLTGFTGFFLSDPRLSVEIILVTLGIFLQAVSASALNQLQEIDLDRRMQRTSHRPLPTGKISKKNAIIFFFTTLAGGTLLIYSAGNLNAALFGLLTLAWYNGVYTFAKRKTAFAVVSGALTGALPPFIGWIAAGGDLFSKEIIFVGFLFFIGQVPHFWLLIIKYGREYEEAGIPSLSGIMNKKQINLLTFTWVITSAVAGLFLCYFQVIHSKVLIIILFIASFYLVWRFKDLISEKGDNDNFRKYFILLNTYFLLILLLLITDRIFLQHLWGIQLY